MSVLQTDWRLARGHLVADTTAGDVIADDDEPAGEVVRSGGPLRRVIGRWR
jgi:hypothetical protein